MIYIQDMNFRWSCDERITWYLTKVILNSGKVNNLGDLAEVFCGEKNVELVLDLPYSVVKYFPSMPYRAYFSTKQIRGAKLHMILDLEG